MGDPRELVKNARWLGHASVMVKGSRTVYVDPWEVDATDPADVILVTHDHYDHLSPPDIAKLARKGTAIVATAPCRAKLNWAITLVEPGSRVTVNGVEVEAVPSYNPGKQFHPRKAGNVGYVFTVDGVRWYHAGDTDQIPEMKDIRADVAFLPVGGTYTMTAEEAAKAASMMQVKVVVPMHYAKIVGSLDDAERFAKLCSVPVVILEKT
ncbi:MAG: MBL fold metallo-hydrolase [Deltaproteobacteria bacterium]|nr:MBL fold metallo-hydrolase [Deltaproteobacteria bacterium]